MHRLLTIPTLFLVLSGCVTTDPRNAASFDYRLPRTDADATLVLTLHGCNSDGTFNVAPDLSVSATPGAQSTLYHIDGRDLASAHIKRGFTIEVDDNGVIKSVNSDTSETTPAIIGNALKIAVAVGGAVMLAEVSHPPRSPLQCTPEIRAAARRAAIIRGQIIQLRRRLAASTAPTPADQVMVRRVNALARELVRLEADDHSPLRIEVSAHIDLGTRPPDLPTALEFDDTTPFARWFSDPMHPSPLTPDQITEIGRQFGLTWTAARVTPTIQDVAPERISSRTGLRRCGFAMPLPNPIPVAVTVNPVGHSLAGIGPAHETSPTAQWQENASLCLDVGFGESRAVGLTFDHFGRRTAMTWNSEATGETVSGALAGMAPDAASLYGSIRGRSAAAEQAEIDRLTRQKSLNELRACQAIIDAGGYDCTPDHD